MSKPYNPNTQGWGFALVVCLLTAGLAGMAYTIHNNTYRHPRDPMTRQVYADQPDAHNAEAGAHEEDEAGHGPEADGESHEAEAGGDEH
jgi:hypothetical protein